MAGETRRRSGGEPLPALFPVVLYSGVRRWSAPLQLRALIDTVPKRLERFQPKMEYVLVDEGALVGRQGGSAVIEPLPRNLAHILFRLEHNKGVDDAAALLNWLARLTAGAAQLETWALNFVDATGLDQVFAD